MVKIVLKPPPVKAGITSLGSRLRVNIADLGIHHGKAQLFKHKGKLLRSGKEEKVADSKLGTPIYSNLIFGEEISIDTLNGSVTGIGENNYMDLEGNIVSYYPIRIDSVIMTVEQSKTIVKTALQGRKGTIKEYISSGDYIISAKGVIDNTINEYPELAVGFLTKIANIPDQIKVTSKFLQQFSINYVVIERFRFTEKQGSRDIQPFELTMVSDIAPEEEV